jgi:hypothetical protein
MGAAGIELVEAINEHSAERTHRAAALAQRMDLQAWAEVGWRAAVARDPVMLKTLDRMAEVMGRLHEAQHGRTQRTTHIEGLKSDLTEYAIWRESFRLADAGMPTRAFIWYYGAAAALAGLQSFPQGA